MSTATTPEMIEAARAVAKAIEPLPGVTSSWIDDWGHFGNFSMFVRIAERSDVDLRAIRRGLKAAVKQFAPKAELRSVIMPKRIYTSAGWGRRQFAGWNSDGRKFEGRGEITISLDFHRFDASTNSFPALQPKGAFEMGQWGVPARTA